VIKDEEQVASASKYNSIFSMEDEVAGEDSKLAENIEEEKEQKQ